MVFLMVAVVLFAALGYAVSESMRSSDPGVFAREIAKNSATDIFQFTSGVRNSVQGLVIDGISDTEISFENPEVENYENANCTSEKCKVFSASGGGIYYVTPSLEWLDHKYASSNHYGTWIFSGNTCVAGVGTGDTDCDTDGDTGTEELIIFLPYIKKSICTEINKRLEFNLSSGAPLKEGSNAWSPGADAPKFTGSYSDENEIGNIATEYNRQRAGCFEGTGTPPSGTYTYYDVILAR